MEWFLTVVTPDGEQRDVVVEADDRTPLTDVAGELAEHCGLSGTPPLFGYDGAVLMGELPLGEAPIYDGSRVWLGLPPGSGEGQQSRYRLPPRHAVLPAHLLLPGPGGALLYARPPRDIPRSSPGTEEPSAEAPRTAPPRHDGVLRRLFGGRAGRKETTEHIEPELEYALGNPFRRNDPHVLRQEAFGMQPALRMPRLWERRSGDDDFLALSVGRMQSGLPLAVSLPDAGVLGIAGLDEWRRSLCAWLVIQAALLHSPADVAFHVIDAAAGEDDTAWRFLRWLPAAQVSGSIGPPTGVSRGLERISRQVVHMQGTILQRRSRGSGNPRTNHRAIVLVFNGARLALRLPGVSGILRDGPAVGIYSICLDSEPRLLPSECQGEIVQVGNRVSYRATADPASPAELSLFIRDYVDPLWLEETARDLAPLRDAADQDEELLRPRRLLHLIDLPGPHGSEVADRWSRTPRATRTVVGTTVGGPMELDLVLDGPHALVTGVSGSGKTELLRTWIAGLAAANRPDEMNFVLIDYKGGGAFGGLAQLPHTVAVVADLSGRLGERVLTALAAELRRRERQLTEATTKDIADYTDMRARSPELPPLPRLVIVVDELAALVHEMPDFVQGLVDTASRGRSLGIHLILGTQRFTAGTLTPHIKAQINLRIALRMMGHLDSIDVIDAPDAGDLAASTPGRAYVRTGASAPVLVQFARVGGRTVDGPRVKVRDLASSSRQAADTTSVPDREAPTDLDLLVNAVREATDLLDIPAPRPPWPPPLGDVVELTDIEPPDGGRDLAPLAFGLEDVPQEQTQRPALLDLATDGNLRVVGGPRSGHSQLLRTLAAAVARQHSTADVHVYGIDCGSGALQAITELPHCGAVVTSGRPDLVVRLLGRLTATVRRRQELLYQGGYADLVAQRQAVPAPRRLPYLLVLLDRWEGFVSRLEDTGHPHAVDDLYALLREGPRVGVCTVLTGGGSAWLRSKVVTLAQRVLVLPAADRDDYLDAGIRPRDVPQQQVAGRAVDAENGREVQIAVLPGPLTGQGQTDALAAFAAAAEERDRHVPPSLRPFRIEDFPLVADQFHVGDAHGRPVGREDVLAWLRDRFATGTSVALLGQRRAGKSWVLQELSQRLEADGATAVRRIVLPADNRADSPDALAALLDDGAGAGPGAAQRLLSRVRGRPGRDRAAFLLDEIGRLVTYDPVVVSWLRDLGQAGAWLVYTGTEKDWNQVVRRALTAPGSSFGNDVNARVLGPLETRDALTFLTGTAANLGVDIAPDRTGAAVLDLVGTWPFYLQVAGDAVVRAVQANTLLPLTDQQALKTLVDRRLLDEWSHHFRARWAEIGPAGRAALLAEPGRVPADAARAQRQDLREVGLLRHGDEWLADRPFFDWIARNESSLRDGEPRA